MHCNIHQELAELTVAAWATRIMFIWSPSASVDVQKQWIKQCCMGAGTPIANAAKDAGKRMNPYCWTMHTFL